MRFGRDLALHRLRLPFDAAYYPVAAVELLAGHDLGPNLALRLDWGGYAIWHLWPDYRVSADGRNLTVYSEEQIDAQLRAHGRGELAELFTGSADVILIENAGPPVAGLSASPDWTPIHRDRGAAVFVPPAVAAELAARRRPGAAAEPDPAERGYFP